MLRKTGHNFTERFLPLCELDGIFAGRGPSATSLTRSRSHAGKIPSDIKRKRMESREHSIKPKRL